MFARCFSASMPWAPISTPTIVPTTMTEPSLRSTLPSALWRFAATIDLPTMCARSVPTTKFIGTPSANSEGPARKLPPTPKKPPSTPMTKPMTTRYTALRCVWETRKSIRAPSLGLGAHEAQQHAGEHFEHDPLADDQQQTDDRVTRLA